MIGSSQTEDLVVVFFPSTFILEVKNIRIYEKEKVKAIIFCAYIYVRSTSNQYCWTIQMLTSPIVIKCSTFSLTISGNRISPALKLIPAMHKNILLS